MRITSNGSRIHLESLSIDQRERKAWNSHFYNVPNYILNNHTNT